MGEIKLQSIKIIRFLISLTKTDLSKRYAYKYRSMKNRYIIIASVKDQIAIYFGPGCAYLDHSGLMLDNYRFDIKFATSMNLSFANIIER